MEWLDFPVQRSDRHGEIGSIEVFSEEPGTASHRANSNPVSVEFLTAAAALLYLYTLFAELPTKSCSYEKAFHSVQEVCSLAPKHRFPLGTALPKWLSPTHMWNIHVGATGRACGDREGQGEVERVIEAGMKLACC